jgi:hypothetical protein
VHAHLGGAVGFVAGAALVGADALLAAVEHGLRRVLDAAQVRRLDLQHVAGPVVGKVLHVLQRIAPFVGHQLHRDAAAVHLLAQKPHVRHLPFALVGVHGALDAQPEGAGRPGQLFQIVGHLAKALVSEQRADGAVHVQVYDRPIPLARAQLQDALAQPRHVLH